MIRTLLLLLILLSSFIPPAARADFESDMADPSHTQNNQSLHELRTLADSGDADAQLNMGGLLFKGQGVTQDYAEAAKWFRMAAAQGQSLAQFNLGMMYATGQGVAQDHTESVKWYRAAAVQGLPVAQLNLGVAYATGQGILQDEVEAVKWLRLSAEQGEPQAQFNLGVMYANGHGIKQDIVESYRWASLAKAQGHETADALMTALSKHMSPEQIAEAKRPASEKNRLADNLESRPAEPTVPDTSPNLLSANNPHTLPANSKDTVQSSEDNGYYLQLGAFRSEAEAKRFIKSTSQKLGRLGKSLSLYTTENWVRIQLGPYPDKTTAQRIASRLKTRYGFDSMVKKH